MNNDPQENIIRSCGLNQLWMEDTKQAKADIRGNRPLRS